MSEREVDLPVDVRNHPLLRNTNTAHAEMRAQHDHEAISRLLYHQELQEQVLLAMARKLQIEVHKIEEMVRQLAEEG
jgi:hypothetical protein